MNFNLFLTRLALISMPFLAACTSGSSSGGGAAPVAPMTKAQKTGFVNFLKESNRTMEVMSVFTTGNPNSRPPTALAIALNMAGPNGSNQPTASGEYSRILNQEISEGKCKLTQGVPKVGKSEMTAKSTISGTSCSFSASYVMVTKTVSDKSMVMDVKMDLAVKNPALLKKSEVSAASVHVNMAINSSNKKSVQMTVAVDGTSQTKTYGPVTNAMNMSMDMPTDGTTPIIAMTGQYSSKAWTAVFSVSTKSDGTATATLNGENLDEETMRAISSGFGPGASQPGQPPTLR